MDEPAEDGKMGSVPRYYGVRTRAFDTFTVEVQERCIKVPQWVWLLLFCFSAFLRFFFASFLVGFFLLLFLFLFVSFGETVGFGTDREYGVEHVWRAESRAFLSVPSCILNLWYLLMQCQHPWTLTEENIPSVSLVEL